MPWLAIPVFVLGLLGLIWLRYRLEACRKNMTLQEWADGHQILLQLPDFRIVVNTQSKQDIFILEQRHLDGMENADWTELTQFTKEIYTDGPMPMFLAQLASSLFYKEKWYARCDPQTQIGAGGDATPPQ